MKKIRLLYIVLLCSSVPLYGMEKDSDVTQLAEQMVTQGLCDEDENLHEFWEYIGSACIPYTFADPEDRYTSPDGIFKIESDSFRYGTFEGNNKASLVISLKDCGSQERKEFQSEKNSDNQSRWSLRKKKHVKAACWKPDSSSFAIVYQKKGKICLRVYAIDRTSNTYRRMSKSFQKSLHDNSSRENFGPFKQCDSLSWSPDGKYISVALENNVHAKLIVFDANTGEFVCMPCLNKSLPSYPNLHEWTKNSNNILCNSISGRDEASVRKMQRCLAIREWVKSGCPSMKKTFTLTDETTGRQVQGPVDNAEIVRLVYKLWRASNESKKVHLSYVDNAYWGCLPYEVQKILRKSIAIARDGIPLLEDESDNE